MTVFQDHLCNDPTEGFLQPNPCTHSHAVFTLWVYNYANTPSPVPPSLLKLNQSSKDIARSVITNYLTRTQCYSICSCMTGCVDIGGLS